MAKYSNALQLSFANLTQFSTTFCFTSLFLFVHLFLVTSKCQQNEKLNSKRGERKGEKKQKWILTNCHSFEVHYIVLKRVVSLFLFFLANSVFVTVVVLPKDPHLKELCLYALVIQLATLQVINARNKRFKMYKQNQREWRKIGEKERKKEKERGKFEQTTRIENVFYISFEQHWFGSNVICLLDISVVMQYVQ